MKIKIVDKNPKLIKAVKQLLKAVPYKDVTAKVGNIFKHKGVIVSASNPLFSMGGGLDAEIAKRYPKECAKAQKKKGVNQRIGDVVFTVTVDEELKSSRRLALTALNFAISKTKSNETLLISGLGTGIGGLATEVFVSALMEALNNLHGYRWKFMSKGMRSVNGDCKWTIGRWKKCKGEPELCLNGFHCSDQIYQAFLYVSDEVLALVEVGGEHVSDDDKSAWQKMRVVKTWKWDKKKSVKLAVFSAERCIGNYEKKYPKDKRPRKAIEAANKWLCNPLRGAAWSAESAARSAAWSAARSAARSAAWSAAAESGTLETIGTYMEQLILNEEKKK